MGKLCSECFEISWHNFQRSNNFWVDCRKMYWADEGGFGVPPKIGKANMDGTSSTVLVSDEVPVAITIDLETKTIYYSTQYPSSVSESRKIFGYIVRNSN